MGAESIADVSFDRVTSPLFGDAKAFLVASLGSLSLGAWAAFSFLATTPVSDAFIPVYVSLTHWQPYCIGMARYGMLVPLLALPFRDPLWNFLFQNFANASLGVASFFLLAACVSEGAIGLAIGAWALALYFGFDDAAYQYEFLSPASHWGPGLALGLAGLLAWQKNGRWAPGVGALLTVLSLWVDVTTALFVVPFGIAIWLARALATGRLLALWQARRWETLVTDRTFEFVLFTATLFVVTLVLAPLLRTDDAAQFLGIVRVGDWPGVWASLFQAFLGTIPGSALIAAGCAIGLSVACRVIAGRREGERLPPMVVAVLVVAAIQWLGLGISGWVRRADFPAMYLLPARVALFSVPAIAAVEAVLKLGSRRVRRVLPVLGLVAAFVGLAVRSPIQSPEQIRRLLDGKGASTEGPALVRERCTHFVARDEPAWSAGFYAALLANDQHLPAPRVLTPRKPLAERRWSVLEGSPPVICSQAVDPTGTFAFMAGTAEWPALELVKHAGPIDLWRVRSYPDW